MDRLFVYGIFLDEGQRRGFGMVNPRYATVLDYATVGHRIVQAVHIPGAGLALTGLLVDMPNSNWEELDALEGGYERIVIRTTSGYEAYMYAER